MKKRIAAIFGLIVILGCIICGMIKTKEGANAEIEEANNDVIEPKVIKISAVGDIMLGRYVATLIKDNFNEPFDEVKEYFEEADIKFGNLECVLSDGNLDNIKGKAKNFCLKGPADMINVLKNIDFNVLSIANNHIYDYGSEGLTDTIYNLSSNDIDFIGAGENLQQARELKIIEVKDTKIGFLGYTDLAYVNFSDKNEIPAASDTKNGVAPLNKEYIMEDIEKAKGKCDLLFVSLHWSDEYTHIPKDSQIELAHQIIDAGVDGILGHHAHNLQGVEIYKDKPIIYNMGNFIFDQNDNLNKDSAIFNLTFVDQDFKGLEIIPCRIEGKKKVTVAKEDDYRRIIDHITKFSEIFDTKLVEKDNKLFIENFDKNLQ